MMRTRGCRLQRLIMLSMLPRFVSKTSIIADPFGKESFKYSPAPKEYDEKSIPFWLWKNY
jgi:hypothetical protein